MVIVVVEAAVAVGRRGEVTGGGVVGERVKSTTHENSDCYRCAVYNTYSYTAYLVHKALVLQMLAKKERGQRPCRTTLALCHIKSVCAAGWLTGWLSQKKHTITIIVSPLSPSEINALPVLYANQRTSLTNESHGWVTTGSSGSRH